jgi:Tfp pilus assembly protein PilN
VIRTNLASRPFYNERAVRLWLLVIAALVILATLFNAWRILHYSGSNTELAAQASRDEARAAELRADAARLRTSVDPAQIETISTDAREANELIDRRTFSWTELFNRFEETLPADVRITLVRPTLDKDRNIVLTVGVLARSVDDVNQFMENLDKTGAFTGLNSVQERVNEQGQIESTLQTGYAPQATPPGGAAAPVATRSTSGPESGGRR